MLEAALIAGAFIVGLVVGIAVIYRMAIYAVRLPWC
jgi:hypothetical protein